MIRLLAFALAVVLTVAVAAADDKEPPKPHVSLKFAGDDKDEGTGGATVALKNTEFKDKALVVNGGYPKGGPGAAQASDVQVTTPKLSYDTFTAAVRFKADEFGQKSGPVLVGGPSYRWFRISRSQDGNLEIGLNQTDTVFEAKKAPLEADKWTVVACSVSVPNKKVVVFVNGKKADEFALPKDFAFTVATSNVKDRDKVWTTVNYSNATTFKGQLGGLVIYDSALTEEQMAKIPLKP